MASRGKPKKQPTKAAQKALNEKAKKAQEEQAQRAQEILEHQEAVVPADRRSMNQNRRVSPQGARNEVAEAESSRTGSGKPIRSPRSSTDRPPPKAAKYDHAKDSEESDGVSSDAVTRFGVVVNPRWPRTRTGPPASSLPASAPRMRSRNQQAGETSSSDAPPPPPTHGSMAPPPVPQRALSESQHATTGFGAPVSELLSQDWAGIINQAGALCDEIDEYQRKYP